MPVRFRLILVVLASASVPAQAGEFAQAPPTPGMVMTRPDPGMANSPAMPVPDAAAPAQRPPASVDPAAGRRRFQGVGSGFSAMDGRLPNQRTGQRRQHVVHDICIGC